MSTYKIKVKNRWIYHSELAFTELISAFKYLELLQNLE